MRRLIQALLIFGATSSLLLSQSTLPDRRLHELVMQGIDLTWRQDYPGADSLFECVIREFPEHPAGYVYKAGVAQAFALDHELPLKSERTDSLLVTGKRKAEVLCSSDTGTEWGYFFLGTANGYDSYARVAGSDWIGGIVKGLSAVSSFEKAIELDSTLTDALGGIGAFYYWRSRKTENFNWLPFFGDRRREGIALLIRNADEGLYNRYTALNMLVAIQTDAENYELAITYAKRALERYPANRVFLWAYATVWEKMGRLNEATSAFESLLHSIEHDPARSAYNDMICHLKLGELLSIRGERNAGAEHLQRVLKNEVTSFPSHLQERARQNMGRAESLLKGLDGGTAQTR